MTTVNLEATLDELFPEHDKECWLEDRIAHEVAELGGIIRRALNLPKIEYRVEAHRVFYWFDCPNGQAFAIGEFFSLISSKWS